MNVGVPLHSWLIDLKDIYVGWQASLNLGGETQEFV